MDFQIRINEWLEVRGLKQAELCRMTGIPTSLMSNYAKGKTSPALDNATAIANALGITLDELVGRGGHALTERERELISMYRELDEADQQEIYNYTEYKHSKKFLREKLSKTAGGNSEGA